MGYCVRFVPNARVAEPEVRESGEVVDAGQVGILQWRVAEAQFPQEEEAVRFAKDWSRAR